MHSYAIPNVADNLPVYSDFRNEQDSFPKMNSWKISVFEYQGSSAIKSRLTRSISDDSFADSLRSLP
jgi:hypothetical protein